MFQYIDPLLQTINGPDYMERACPVERAENTILAR